MMTTVTHAETNLLTLARTAVGLMPAADAMRLLTVPVDAPAKLGPSAQWLLRQTLSYGTVLTLARQGGWQQEAGGRLWERHPAPQLGFTGNVVRLFQWLLKTRLTDPDPAPLATQGPLTLAESILATSLLDQLRGTGCTAALARQPALRAAPLVVLAHTFELARLGPLAVPVFEPAVLSLPVEGLGALLTRAWVSAERAKRDVADPAVLARVGSAQEQVLDAFLTAIDAAQARRLATFLIDAGAEWLAGPRSAEELLRGLSHDAPLRERTQARRRAGAFLRVFARLRAWDQEHRATRFFDDGYEGAQALVRRWEPMTDARFTSAAHLAASLEALSQQATP
jgi:hypothetical protein